MSANDDILARIDAKHSESLRYVTFNVNGLKTFFNYFPWNKCRSDLLKVLHHLNADIACLQELKMSPNTLSQVNVTNMDYRCFISVPKVKKGYSGVGLFVRIPTDDELDLVKTNLAVVKAEEGITGRLTSPDYNKPYVELDLDQLIGGYPDISRELALSLDSEGRSVVVELASGVIIFALYCPANSMQTEEGEKFRLDFLTVLLERCKYLKDVLKKEVVIMGDINVALDLIDQAEGINERLKRGLVKFVDDGEAFDRLNIAECLGFKAEKPSRTLLSRYVFPTMKLNSPNLLHDTQFLYDSTRIHIKRRMAVYTVWNTINNSRQTNYGSRIDLILTSSRYMSDNITAADIWPFVQGSDHCPVFTDFKLLEINEIKVQPTKLKLEAKSFYKLVRHQDISSMFKSVKRKTVDEKTEPPSNTLVYKSRKTTKNQPSIGNFFFNNVTEHTTSSYEKVTKVSESKVTATSILLAYGEPPNCQHGEKCQLKTSLTNIKTRGKKFWCCPRNEKGLTEGRCDFFQWVSK